MRRIFLLIVNLLAVVAISAADVSEREVMRSLRNLDSRIAMRATYKSMRHGRIDSLRSRLRDLAGNQLIDATLRLADSYNAFDNDSSLYFYSHGLQLALTAGNDSLVDIFRLRRAMFMPLSGSVGDAINELSMVDTIGCSKLKKVSFLESARQMYSYISASRYERIDEQEFWNNRALEEQRKLLWILSPGTDLYLLNRGEYLYYLHQYSDARAVLQSLVDRLSDESNLYARAYHMLADIARAQGENNRRISCLAISAAADVSAATLEVVSLQELGVYLYEHGDLERSYNYLSVALENAVECKATMRMLSISKVLPIIGKAHSDQSAQSRRLLTAALLITIAFLLALTGLLIYLKKQIRRRQMLQNHLEGANLTKEIYLNQFMNLCSVYMDKLISFNKLVDRKISAGKVDDLYKMTKSGKFIEEQTTEFYDMFDKSFLNIYPSFVESVNALLLPDKQITLDAGGRLNTDLRILAFMRLGLDDATRVAQVLNYSVNTIYAYRNRLRNRARNRDTFEADIMKIKSI